MRVCLSQSVNSTRTDLENHLWTVACHAKNLDPDIKLMGLHLRVKSGHNRKPSDWHGWAYPHEESIFYRKLLIHPAGRVDLTIGPAVSLSAITRLFAHELRHIGQFHRGRHHFGYLTTEHMVEDEIEPDCLEFEVSVVKVMNRSYGYSSCQK